jgi:hypothetical protein
MCAQPNGSLGDLPILTSTLVVRGPRCNGLATSRACPGRGYLGGLPALSVAAISVCAAKGAGDDATDSPDRQSLAAGGRRDNGQPRGRPADRVGPLGGLAGFGRTMLVAHLLGQLAPFPSRPVRAHRRQGRPDYDRLIPRAWLAAKDDLNQVRDVLRQVHQLMVDRQRAIASVLG